MSQGGGRAMEMEGNCGGDEGHEEGVTHIPHTWDSDRIFTSTDSWWSKSQSQYLSPSVNVITRLMYPQLTQYNTLPT